VPFLTLTSIASHMTPIAWHLASITSHLTFVAYLIFFLKEVCQISWKCVPILVFVIELNVVEEINEIVYWIFLPANYAGIKAHIVRVGIQKDHAAILRDPVDFLFPDFDGFFLEDDV